MSFASWLRGLATGTQRARRNSRPASRTRHFLPRLECLEDRSLLAAFATFQGDVATPKETDVIPLRVDAADFSLHRWGAFLGFEMHAVGGSRLDPSRIQIRPQSRRATATAWQSSNSATQSVTLATVRPGSFQLVVGGDRRTTGDYQVDVFLVGDANANQRVDNRDVQLIRSLRGQRLGRPGYLRDADANRDGRINAADEGLARANSGAATRIRPLTLSASIDPATVTGVQPGAQADVTIVGQTLPNAAVKLDQGADGSFELTGTADGQGHYQFTVGASAGTTQFQVLARGPFSQQRTAELEVFVPLAIPTQVDVTLDEAHTASAIITDVGGTLTTTGADGTSITLVIPPGALLDEQTISVTPIASIADLPLDIVFAGGVQFGPDGLSFLQPVTVTIDVPAGFDPAQLIALVYEGDGQDIHLVPAEVHGTTVTVQVLHFSGVSLGLATPETLDDLLLQTSPNSFEGQFYPLFTLARYQHNQTGQVATGTLFAMTNVLRDWFDNDVAPNLSAGDTSEERLLQGLRSFREWTYALDQATDIVPMYTEIFAARRQLGADLAARDLRNAITRANQTCLAQNNFDFAVAATRWYRIAKEFGLDTPERFLDLDTVRDQLCVSVVVQSTSFPQELAANQPPGTGYQPAPLIVQAGISFDGGPAVFDERVVVDFVADSLQEGILPLAQLSDVTDSNGFASLLVTPRGDRVVRLAFFVYSERLSFPFAIDSDLERGDLTVNPHIVTLGPGESQQFNAVLNAFEDRPIVPATWTASAGTIDQNGFFTYPSDPVGDIAVTATLNDTPATSATAAVLVGNQQVVTIFPSQVSLLPGGTQQFTGSVPGLPNQNVTWSATGGTITPTGLFTAGDAAGTFQVTATSVANSALTASAEVVVSLVRIGLYTSIGSTAQSDPDDVICGDRRGGSGQPYPWTMDVASIPGDPVGIRITLKTVPGGTTPEFTLTAARLLPDPGTTVFVQRFGGFGFANGEPVVVKLATSDSIQGPRAEISFYKDVTFEPIQPLASCQPFNVAGTFVATFWSVLFAGPSP